MSKQPEAVFLQGVRALLPSSIYTMKTHNPFIGGCPDLYVEGNAGILWLEFKFLDVVPSALLLSDGKLTRLQQDWLYRAELNGVQSAVIVGHKQQGVVFHGRTQWNLPVTREEFMARAVPRARIADWISQCVLSSPSSASS